MNKSKKKLTELQKRLVRIVVSAAALFAVAVIINVTNAAFWVKLTLYLAVYALIGYDVLYRAVTNVLRGKLLDENFLMCVATIGAFIIGEYLEAVAVMLFYQTGELFQSYAVGKSREGVKDLMSIAPDEATVLRDGGELTVLPDEVEIGETIIVRAGERIAIDGVVVSGETNLNVAALTGESVPKFVSRGSEVLSGSISENGVLYIKTTKEFSDSTVSRILDMVENASMRKAKAENFITKFSRYYTPAVCGVALLLAVIPSLITGSWSEWVFKALSLLVISCPCALVISVPLGFFGGIGSASKNGILVKGGGTFEALNKVNAFVFDKTGTITEGKFSVSKIIPAGVQKAGVGAEKLGLEGENADIDAEDELLKLAAYIERGSSHPLARAIVAEAERRNLRAIALGRIEISEVAGKGVIATQNGQTFLCGNAKLLKENGTADFCEYAGGCSVVYIACNGNYAGCIVVSDKIKSGSRAAISELKRAGAKTYMLTGDNEQNALVIASESAVNEHIAGLLPNEKVSALEEIMQKTNGGVCFVGDGINDAPVIMRADVGVAMGGVGSDSAIEAADVVLMNDDLGSLITARKIAKKTLKIVKQNVVFALAVKFAVLVLSIIGVPYLMWFAVFADVGVSVLAILNSMRCLRLKKQKA